MLRILLVGLLMIPTSALAKSPEDVGRLFADVVACHLDGKFNKIEKAAVDLKIIKRYKVAEQTRMKKRMKKGRNKEFRRLDDIGEIEKGIMCGVIEKKWLD